GRVVLIVDGDLPAPRLDPDACDGVLPLAGGVGAAERVELLLVTGLFGGSRALERAQVVEGSGFLCHLYQALAFLRLRAAMSSGAGDWAAGGCSAPLLTVRLRMCSSWRG